MELLLEHVNNGFWLALMLSLPAVLIAASVGLIVGILQAVTQVQEQTLSAAPKILFVFLLLIFTGGLMMTMMGNYIRESFYLAFEEVPHSEAMMIPSLPETDGQRRAHDFFKQQLSIGPDGKAKSFFTQPAKKEGTDGQFSGGMQIQPGTPKPQPTISEQMYLKKKSQ